MVEIKPYHAGFCEVHIMKRKQRRFVERATRALPLLLTFSLFVFLSQSHIRTQAGAGEAEAAPMYQRPSLPPPQVQPPFIEGCTTETFPFGSAALGKEHYACIDRIKYIGDPNYLIIIEGHRDSSERIGISLTRANNLRDYLVNDRKVDASRIRVRNFSTTCPSYRGETFRNSRIEIGVLPVSKGTELQYNNTVYPCQRGSNPHLIEGESPA
jgi:hypothetical protein